MYLLDKNGSVKSVCVCVASPKLHVTRLGSGKVSHADGYTRRARMLPIRNTRAYIT